MTEPATQYPQPPAPNRPRRTNPVPVILYYLAIPILSYALILATANGSPVVAIMTGMVTLFGYWVAFARTNPRIIGFELIGVVLATYYRVDPPMAVLWVAAAAVTAGLGVWLQRNNNEEDHFFFLVPAVTAACFVTLVWLGAGARIEPAVAKARRELKVNRELLAQIINETDQKTEEGQLIHEVFKTVEPRFDLLMVTTWLIMWTLGIWVAGRVARGVLGEFYGRRHSLAFFRIGRPYIFLLILGLILEILNGLAPAWGMQWLAIPLLAVFSLACFIEGVAVVLFYGAVQRLKGRRWGSHVWNLAGLFLALRVPQLAILVGLSDVWFDYRRLHMLRERIDYEA